MNTDNKTFIPTNKQVLLEEVEKENKQEDDDGVVVPESFKKKSRSQEGNHIKLYKIIEVALDCSPNYRTSGKGKIAAVDSSMVERFTLGEKEYLIVTENHIRGFFMDVVR